MDLNLLQLIKAGKEGVFYKARMTRGTCKGHSMVTCKISKEGIRSCLVYGVLIKNEVVVSFLKESWPTSKCIFMVFYLPLHDSKISNFVL